MNVTKITPEQTDPSGPNGTFAQDVCPAQSKRASKRAGAYIDMPGTVACLLPKKAEVSKRISCPLAPAKDSCTPEYFPTRYP